MKIIMRDLEAGLIEFITTDNEPVCFADYRMLQQRGYYGRSPHQVLKGVYHRFKSGVNRTNNTYTENVLFVPEFNVKN